MSKNIVFDCNFCNKSFKSKSNLTLHQKTAKYCLDLRNIDNQEYICEYCLKNFANKSKLDLHIKKSCKEKIGNEKTQIIQRCETELEMFKKQMDEYKKEVKKQINEYKKQIEEYKEENKKLQETISKIALCQKGNNTTNIISHNNNSNNGNNSNNINNTNTLNLNDTEFMKNFITENLDKNVVGCGQKGIAKMVYEKYLKGPDGQSRYKCVDSSRQMFEFVNNNGEVERDSKANKLKMALIRGNIQEKASELGPQLWTEEDGSHDAFKHDYYLLKVTEIVNIENDDKNFRSEIATLTV